jgi:2-oxo-4-hydroxy-4-carboxy--5-ureidoimidazoline (OHCU) decarboxylase
VLENFRERIDSDRDDEFAEALRQVHRIAWLRLQEIECYN